MWGNDPHVRRTALPKKMTSLADQGAVNSNWFKFLWSAFPLCSTPMQPGIPAAPCALQFIHPYTTSRSLIPSRFVSPYTLFPCLAVHTSAFLLLHQSLIAHQRLGPGFQLCVCTISRIVWSALHSPALVLRSL